MDTRKILEDRLRTLDALGRGGISRGVGPASADAVTAQLASQWETQRQLVRRVLAEPGDPIERLLDWRERTTGFVDRFPEREGWSDREGVHWNAAQVLEAIETLLETIESWQDELFDEEEEDGF